MKKIDFIIAILFILFVLSVMCSCMINDDWHTHQLEYNTIDKTLLVDGEVNDRVMYELGAEGIGITFYLGEPMDNFTWHFNTLNEFGVRYSEIIDGDMVYIPHDFNVHPGEVFKATTYLVESHYHFITNLN